MLVYIYRFFCGYVTIKIFGDFPERFINICAFNRIQLWNIRRKKDCIFAKVSVKDYFKIRSVKKNRSVHIKLINKKGVYFAIKPYFKRKGFFVGIIMFFLIIVFLSQFIWNIEVIGNKTIDRKDIIKSCEEIGIKEGVPAAAIDTNSARLKLLLNNEKLSWASFIIEGSHLSVNVLETKTVDQKDTSPNNLVAMKDGVVEKIMVSGGKSVVKKNQAVLKGDLLVSGAIEYSNGTTDFVHCEGEVFASTERIEIFETPLKITEIHQTERTVKRRVLTFFGLKIPLSLTPIDFDFSKEVTDANITNGSSYSPIYVSTVIYKEKTQKEVKLNVDEAKERLKKIAKKKENSKFKNVEILSYSDEFIHKNDRIIMKRKYNCIENIATSEKIKIINVN